MNAAKFLNKISVRNTLRMIRKNGIFLLRSSPYTCCPVIGFLALLSKTYLVIMEFVFIAC